MEFEPLYEEQGGLSSSFFQSSEAKRRLVRKSANLNIGPKWRDEHVTLFRATNHSVVAAAENNTQQLFDYIVDDIGAGTIRAYDDCDIMLDEYIHPDSPKMISVRLRDLSINDEPSPLSDSVPVPLYLCLIPSQMADIILQYGIDVNEITFQDTDNVDHYPLQLIPCNRNSGYRSKKRVPPCLLENFVNEIAGRLNRQIATNDGNWDKNEKFFQKIDFKFRVAPRNSITLSSLQPVVRGPGNPDFVSKESAEQAEVPNKNKKKYNGQKKQFESVNGPSKRDKLLDEIGEDGSSQAGMLEWKFQMNTHRLMSPQLFSAFNQAAAQIDARFDTHRDVKRYLADPTKKSHLANLIEYELLEGETNLRVYTDARAQQRATEKKIFAIYSLRNSSQ